jgi:hypothetical protein
METGDRALRLRICKQEILADLGVKALKGIPFPELLNETVSLSAEGLEAQFSKVLEYVSSENRLLMRAVTAQAGGPFYATPTATSVTITSTAGTQTVSWQAIGS